MPLFLQKRHLKEVGSKTKRADEWWKLKIDPGPKYLIRKLQAVYCLFSATL